MNDIGSKIKITASILFFLEIIGSIIAAIVCFSDSLAGIGCALLFGGPLAAWLIFMMVYGFGQLVENSDYLRKSQEKSGSIMNSGKSDRPKETEPKPSKQQTAPKKTEPKPSKQQTAPKESHNEKINIEKAHDGSDEDLAVFDCPKCNSELTVLKGYLKENPVITCPECNFEFDVNDYYKL